MQDRRRRNNLRTMRVLPPDSGVRVTESFDVSDLTEGVVIAQVFIGSRQIFLNILETKDGEILIKVQRTAQGQIDAKGKVS